MPTNPPDAVSGAATPQTCPKCGEPTFGCGWHTLPNKHWVSLECPRNAGQAEPAATPEAQIPDNDSRLEAARDERDNLHGIIECLESQLAALRIERDQAWNERFDAGKLSALDTVAKSFEAWIFSGRWTSKDVGRALREIHDVAARPIPAEPKCEEK
jgi:hypothetical protein